MRITYREEVHKLLCDLSIKNIVSTPEDELAKDIGISQPAVHKHLVEMIEDGLIEKIPGKYKTARSSYRILKRSKPKERISSSVYGGKKQAIRDTVIKAFDFAEVILTFPGEDYNPKNNRLVENQGQKVIGLECVNETFKLLENRNSADKLELYNMKDSEYFKAVSKKIDAAFLDYCGFFHKQKAGLISLLKYNRLNDNGCIALTYNINDRQGFIVGDERLGETHKHLLKIFSKLGYTYKKSSHEWYKNDDIKSKPTTMGFFLFEGVNKK